MSDNSSNTDYIPLSAYQIAILERQGCSCGDWTQVKVSAHTDLSKIHRVNFAGEILIGNNVVLSDIGLLEAQSFSDCGIGTEVSVLDETGSRAIRIYPGISAQLALIAARCPEWSHGMAKHIIDSHIIKFVSPPAIGDGAVVRNCGILRDINIGSGCVIEGAQYLNNGTIINNSIQPASLTHIGFGVNAENFIIEDAAVESGTLLRNCYVGQGCVLDKGFTAHDSLFFANCMMENGEACALFAGPYTVSMHKSSLLIGCQTSFMNAGSGTNQSNHMYKLGPKHWGILERGVKTSSDSYIMFGAKIGAFSLLMGQHKTHPDSSEFPFSYLFGDDRGATVVVPAAMLRSCGLMRDEKKWPLRDLRLNRVKHLNDRIIYDVLNPLTVETMLKALDVIQQLLTHPADDDRYLRYKGMKLTRASIERARYLYELAIYKYLHIHSAENDDIHNNTDTKPVEWLDIAGLLVSRNTLQEIMAMESIDAMEQAFDLEFKNYDTYQRKWIASRFTEKWHKHPEVIANYASEFDRMIEEDRNKSLEDIAIQNEMLRLL